MLSNYLLMAWRQLRRNRLYSLINITGRTGPGRCPERYSDLKLLIGLAIAVLIA